MVLFPHMPSFKEYLDSAEYQTNPEPEDIVIQSGFPQVPADEIDEPPVIAQAKFVGNPRDTTFFEISRGNNTVALTQPRRSEILVSFNNGSGLIQFLNTNTSPDIPTFPLSKTKHIPLFDAHNSAKEVQKGKTTRVHYSRKMHPQKQIKK